MSLALGVFRYQPVVLLLMLLSSLILHAAGFLIVGIINPTQPVGWHKPSRVYLMQPRLERGNGREYLYLLADLMDPSLLSLPNHKGFSQPAWAREFSVPMKSVAWDADPSFLGMDPRPADRVLLKQSSLPEALEHDVRKSELLLPADEAKIIAEPPPTPSSQSVMRLDTGLQNRTLLKPAILPVVTHPSGLKPTRVRIGVSWDGRVRYALIEQGSGDPSADASAVEASRGMRFAPIQRPLSDAVSWALATCYWATTPPVAVESLEAETSP